MTGDPVILVNRTSQELQFTADGRTHKLKPGDNYGFSQGHVRLAMAQNPLMGSEEYHSLNFTSLVGVKKTDGEAYPETPIDPIDDDTLLAAMESIERFDRASAGLRPAVRVAPRFPGLRGRIETSMDASVLGVSARA